MRLGLVMPLLMAVAAHGATTEAKTERPEPVIAGLDEYYAQAGERARKLAGTVFPTPADLDKTTGTWRYRWELPESMGRRISEADYWNKLYSEGFPPGATSELAGKLVETAVAEAQADGEDPRQAAVMCLIAFREMGRPLLQRWDENIENWRWYMKTTEAARADPKQAAALKQGLGEDLMRRQLKERYQHLSMEQIKADAVRHATLVREGTTMVYFKSNNWSAHGNLSEQDLVKRGIWYGFARVSLRLVDPQRIREVPDLNPADAPALEQRLDTYHRAMLAEDVREEHASIERVIAELKRERTRDELRIKALEDKLARERAAIRNMAVKVTPRSLGSNCYVIRIHVTSADTPALRVSEYCGWLRNGRALVQVEFEGNIPEAEMTKEMDHLLTDMEGRTAIYGGLGGDL